jgi:ABC-type bacteriocin/lantibiotic exporter with double-glycine peptidase domain
LAITEDILNDSLKNSKILGVNKNEFLLNIKKIGDLKNIMHLINSYFIPTLLISICVSVYFFNYNKTYGIIVFLLLIGTEYILYKLSLDSFYKSQIVDKNINNWYDDIFDVLTNVDSLYISNTFENEMKRIGKTKNSVYNLYKDSEISSSNLKFIFTIIYLILMIIINGIAYKMYSDGIIGKAALVAICYVILSLIQYYDCATYELKNLITNFGKYGELKNFFHEFGQNNNEEKRNINKLNNINDGNIEFRNIKLNYQNKQLFEDFNLKINGDTCTGIIGEVGSGKSTLLKMLTGLTEYEGDIIIDGQKINNVKREQLIKHIGFVPQNPKLFNRSIYENIAYGTDYTISEIEEKINNLGIGDFIKELKSGLNTPAGRNGDALSGGQRQIVYILRVLMQNKQIILMDEPTSAIDMKNREMFIKLLKSINKTIVIVSHDDELFKVFDRIITLKNGKIVKDRIMKNNDVGLKFKDNYKNLK